MNIKILEEFNLPLTDARKDSYKDSEGNGDGTINVVLEIEAWCRVIDLEVTDSEIYDVCEVLEHSNKSIELDDNDLAFVETEIHEYIWENWDKYL